MAGDFGFLKGNIETIILNALHNGDKYGYEIAKEIKEKTENQYEIKQPTLYSYLKRLESNNLITSYWGAESNGGRRRYYKLTEKGREDCERFSAEWKYHRDVMDNLVDTDDNELPHLTQEEVTPLFGTKTKRTRKGVSVDAYDEQELIARKLAEINKSKLSEQESYANTTDSVVVSNDVQVSITDAVVDVPQNEIPLNDTNNSQQNNEIVSVKADDVSYEIINNDQQSVSQQMTVIDEVKDSASSERVYNVINNNIIQQTENNNVESQITESQQEITDRFEVNQDDADAFMAKLDERINAMHLHTASKEDDDIDYQNVLLNVMGKQLSEMESFNNSNPDERYDYTCERPLALEDVADEFAKEGIRMRIYNRTTAVYRPKKLLPLNKIYCQTAWISYAIAVVLLGVLLLATKTFSNWIAYVVVAGILLIAPLAFTFYFMSDPSRKNQPVFNFKQLLIICAIVAGLICLFAFGINILMFDLKFSNIGQVATQVGIPSILGLCPLIVVAILKARLIHYSK